MDKKALSHAIESADAQARAEALAVLLDAHASPVFGAAKATEHEVAAFRAFQRLGILSAEPDEYDLIMTLRVTKAKARALLYQVALRASPGADAMDASLRELVSQPLVGKDGDKILIEVANPLLMDSLRQRIRRLGHISDGSFSGSLAKVSVSAFGALVADLVPDDRQAAIKTRLREQGIAGDDLPGLISGALGRFGKQVAGATGQRVAERIGSKVADFFVEGVGEAFDWVQGQGPHL